MILSQRIGMIKHADNSKSMRMQYARQYARANSKRSAGGSFEDDADDKLVNGIGKRASRGKYRQAKNLPYHRSRKPNAKPIPNAMQSY
jgi:hypothetical protein